MAIQCGAYIHRFYFYHGQCLNWDDNLRHPLECMAEQIRPQSRMSRPYSDATLDALAATRSTRSLSDAIELHRALYAADKYIPRLAADEPPVFTDGKTGERSSDEMSKIGPTLSWPLTSYIAYKIEEGDQIDTPSGMYPWARSLAAMRQLLCRKQHPEHLTRDYWRGSLCWQLVNFTIRREFSMWNTSRILKVSEDRASRTLHNALRWIEADMDLQFERAKQRAKADAGQHDWREAPHVHEPLGGLHSSECPQCMREAG